MLFGPDGFALGDVPPGPNPLTEERVNEELRSFDSLLHIRWVEYAYFNQTHQRFEGRYALCAWWPKADKRWEMVQQNQHDATAAYDIMGWFCEDMHDAATVPKDPVSMMQRVQRLLYEADNTRVPWARRMAQTAAHNAQQKQRAVREAGELAEAAAREVVGMKSMRVGKKTSDPSRLDFSGLERELNQELGVEDVG